MSPKTRGKVRKEAEPEVEDEAHHVPVLEVGDEYEELDAADDGDDAPVDEYEENPRCDVHDEEEDELDGNQKLSQEIDFTSSDRKLSGVLTTIVGIKEVPRYSGWLSELEVGLYLELKGGEEGKKKVGSVIAYMVNRIRLPDDNSPSRFVEELMVRNTLKPDRRTGDEDSTGELRQILRMLYRRNGAIQNNVTEHEDALSEERLVFIDTFKLNDHCSTGLAQLALRSFHQLIARYLEVRTVVLSPARSEGSEWGALNDVEIERRLIRAYRKNRYEVWIQGDEDVEGSVTVMGRRWDSRIGVPW